MIESPDQLERDGNSASDKRLTEVMDNFERAKEIEGRADKTLKQYE